MRRVYGSNAPRSPRRFLSRRTGEEANTRVREWVALVLIVLVAAVAGCGGSEDGSEEGWIVELLRRVPDTAAGADALVVDLGRAEAAAGIEAPGPQASSEAIAGYFFGLPRDAMVPDLLREVFPDFDALAQELGIDPMLVTAAITAGTPPETLQVLAGEFDPAVIDQAVQTDPSWSDLLATADHREVTYYTWGADFESNLDRVTPVRRLGRGGRLALDDGYLYWALWTAGIQSLIDAGAGAVPTLADQSALRRTAEALEAKEVYSAILSAAPFRDQAAGSALTLGLGGGRDADGAFWVVVAVHVSPEAAAEAAAEVERILTSGTIAAYQQPWSERVSGVAVEVQGDLMVVVARSTGPEGDWVRAYWSADPLFAAARS